MNAIQLLPDITECLSNVQIFGNASAAEPYRRHMESILIEFSPPELADLNDCLPVGLAEMKPDVMVKRCTLVRKLILVLEQIIREKVHP